MLFYKFGVQQCQCTLKGTMLAQLHCSNEFQKCTAPLRFIKFTKKIMFVCWFSEAEASKPLLGTRWPSIVFFSKAYKIRKKAKLVCIRMDR